MAKKKNTIDPVKKIFGKTAKEIFSTPTDHSKYHSPNAFCGSAGPEEMKHFQELLDVLSDKQLAKLAYAVGISDTPTQDIDRDQVESLLDETDREDFYREYHKLVGNR